MKIEDLVRDPRVGLGAQARLRDLYGRLGTWPLWQFTSKDGTVWLFQPVQGSVGLLWRTKAEHALTRAAAQAYVAIQGTTVGRGPWRLPTSRELYDFACLPANPLRSGKANRLKDQCEVFSSETVCDLDYSDFATMARARNASGHIYLVCETDLDHLHTLNWMLGSVDSVLPAKGTNAECVWKPVRQGLSMKELVRGIDWRSVRLPKLDESDFNDPNKGVWEFWGEPAENLGEWGIIARDPSKDIQAVNVAIDFGTSSTVVAYESNGRKHLLRVGVQDYGKAPEPGDYENPTVLEFIDLSRLLQAWKTVAYRPEVSWEHVRTSHEALHSLRDNGADPGRVASILPKIKQWALRQNDDLRVRICDRTRDKSGKPVEHELEPLTLRAPVKGVPLEVSTDDPFDPVELYAWFLGMMVNWRKLGIHLRYYMTFPVEYPREVRDKILSSFKRGLQRSLPHTLAAQAHLEKFIVEERASEPAAYAASALKEIGIKPSQQGVAYAVFDFGGGTTDFDFGYYRLPDDDEADQGFEEVFEHFAPGGDKFLGGENLLEHMAYRVFQHNIDQCRRHGIPFYLPLDAAKFPGSETLLDGSRPAMTNMIMLMTELRPLWETGELENSSGVKKVNLLNRDGHRVSCELSVPADDLLLYLQDRIGSGIHNFCVALHRAFGADAPGQIQILLAGNASRSKWVRAYFGLCEEDSDANEALFAITEGWLDDLFGGDAPLILPHAPLPVQPDKPYAPTAKTGVALGLLDLCPGGVIKVINRSAPGPAAEAPFAHYVGRIRSGLFQPGLQQGATYHHWVELGPQREKVFELRHTTAPQALTGNMPKDAPGLKAHRLDFSGEMDGHKVFARPVGPNTIEICTALSLADANGDNFSNLQQLGL